MDEQISCLKKRREAEPKNRKLILLFLMEIQLGIVIFPVLFFNIIYRGLRGFWGEEEGKTNFLIDFGHL